MDNLHQAIIDTLGYFSILRCPLTTNELYRRLHGVKILKIELEAFLQNKPEGIIKRDGYYALEGREADIEIRKRNSEITKHKWEVLEPKLKLLRKVPFLRGLCVSGSVSAGYADSDSDIDIFIIAKKGRIWLCRGFLALILKKEGWYRQEEKGDIQDQLCPNHFITEDGLRLQPRSIYTAHLFSQFSPVIGETVCEKLVTENLGWIWGFLPNSTGTEPASVKVRERMKMNPVEILLWGPIGALAERLARWMQLRKIRSNPDFADRDVNGGLKFSNTELTFHGKPQEPMMLQRLEEVRKNLFG